MQFDPAEMLVKVVPVEAPPFLLTRIRQRIANVSQRVPAKWVAATAVSMACILMLNIYIISGRSDMRAQEDGTQLARAMNLFPDNSLYR